MGLGLLFISSVFAQSNSIYIWDFSDRNGETSDLSISLTDEFEQALHSTDCCQILQRRNYARLFSQRENEKAISGLRSLPTDFQNRLIDLKAEMVAFGELFDDTNSGQFKISVSIENFEGEILKSASTYMAKYDIHNPKKREKSLLEIIDRLKFLPSIIPPVVTENVDEWTFSLTGCTRIGKDVKCGYIVTSNYRDREFSLSAKSRAFDEYGYEYRTSSQQLANKTTSGNATMKTMLIDGVQTVGFIKFENISSRATKFTLLEFKVRGDDLSADAFPFRNVIIN